MKRSIDGIEKDPRICLNVGGRRLETRKSVLCSVEGTMLDRMFNGNISSVLDDDGYYFIDRDGQIFEKYILRYLRCVADVSELPIVSIKKRSFVNKEFEYFGIPRLFDEEIDATQVSPLSCVNAGFYQVIRATIHNNLLIVETDKNQRFCITIFDVETFKQKGTTIDGVLPSSNSHFIEDKMFYKLQHGNLQCYDLTVLKPSNTFETLRTCSQFVCMKNVIISVDVGGPKEIVVQDIYGQDIGQAYNLLVYIEDIIAMLFDDDDILYIISPKKILVYRINFSSIDSSTNDLMKEPFLRPITYVTLGEPLISAVMCESILCTASTKTINMWDRTDFRIESTKRFSFGIGKIKTIVTMGLYIIASTGVSGDILKIYKKNINTMIDKIDIKHTVTSLNAVGKYLLIGGSAGNIDVWSC